MVEKIKGYYNAGLWSLDRVWNVVGKAITAEDYFDITGFIYPSKELANAPEYLPDPVV